MKLQIVIGVILFVSLLFIIKKSYEGFIFAPKPGFIIVGPSQSNKKKIDLNNTGYDISMCPSEVTVNRDNWDIYFAKEHASSLDKFKIEHDKIKNKVIVERTDKNSGWNMDLAYDCSKAKPINKSEIKNTLVNEVKAKSIPGNVVINVDTRDLADKIETLNKRFDKLEGKIFW